jgi:HEPN domain-containing protein
MKNDSLVQDHMKRSKSRLAALAVLREHESWADVVREAQEVVELLLKALLRSANIAPPRVHDVSPVLVAEHARLPQAVQAHVERLAQISRQLRRDRELAFYGSEDLTPSDFYQQCDGEEAFEYATWVFQVVSSAVGDTNPTTGKT